jgi:hypothetical protein
MKKTKIKVDIVERSETVDRMACSSAKQIPVLICNQITSEAIQRKYTHSSDRVSIQTIPLVCVVRTVPNEIGKKFNFISGLQLIQKHAKYRNC